MNHRTPILPLILIIAFAVTACDAKDGSASASSQSHAEPTTQPESNMRISLKLQDETLTATLYDNATARDFASLLPLTLTLDDYSKTEKISDLPKKLTKVNAPAGADPAVGDIAYYAPWGNLALFYKDFQYSDGLILLGKLDGDADALSVPGALKVTIELLDKDAQVRGG